MSSDPTDISSDIEVTAVEADAFDKQELIVWASKLELESIDYRTASMELLEKLSKLSKTLTESLNSVKNHIFEMKINGSERDRKLKNFIELTVAGEVDEVYEKISFVSNKIKDVQNSVHAIENVDLQSVERKFNSFLKIQDEKNKTFEEQLKSLQMLLENATKVHPHTPTPSNELKTGLGSLNFPQRAKTKRPDKKQNTVSRRSYSSKKNEFRITKHSQQRRTSAFTRKLIFE